MELDRHPDDPTPRRPGTRTREGAAPPTSDGVAAERDPGEIRGHWNVRSFDFGGAHPRLILIATMILGLPEIMTMLDVGCGPAPLRDIVPRHIEYFGIDIATSVIAAMRDPAHFEAVDLDERQEAFGGRRFDLVVCSGVFEYINRRQAFIDFLKRKVRPGGWLIMSFTNHQHRKDGLHWVRGHYTSYTDPHVNFLLVPQIRALLRDNGWQILQHRTLTASGREHPILHRFVHFPLNILNRTYVFLCRSRESAASTGAHAPT